MQHQFENPIHSKPKLQINNSRLLNNGSLKSAVKSTKPLNPLVAANQAWVLPIKVGQRAANMALNKARLLHKLEQDAYASLWTNGDKNSEIQVGLDGAVATVGWNVGGSLRVNAPPSVRKVQDTLDQMLSDNSDAYDALMGGGTAVTAINYIRTKTNNVAAVEGRTIHAEGIIIAEHIKKMLQTIRDRQVLAPSTLSVMGKKAACVQCGNIIGRLNSHSGISRFLTIQTPSDATFESATGDNATHGHQSSKWTNPLHLIKEEILQTAKFVRDNVSPGGSVAGLDYDKLLHFLSGLETEANRPNPM